MFEGIWGDLPLLELFSSDFLLQAQDFPHDFKWVYSLFLLVVDAISVVLIYLFITTLIGSKLHVHSAFSYIEASQIADLSEGKLEERMSIHKVELYRSSIIVVFFFA